MYVFDDVSRSLPLSRGSRQGVLVCISAITFEIMHILMNFNEFFPGEMLFSISLCAEFFYPHHTHLVALALVVCDVFLLLFIWIFVDNKRNQVFTCKLSGWLVYHCRF